MTALRLCGCGLAMYATEGPDGDWFYACEACDPELAATINGRA